jgi:hypothetical protein
MNKIYMYAALVCLTITCSSLAYGDAILTGSVTNRDLTNGMCSQSGVASSLSLLCGTGPGTPQGYASLIGIVGPTSGSVTVNLDSFETPIGQPFNTTLASGLFSVSVNGTYVLAGGSGSGLFSWTMDSFHRGGGGGGTFGPCSIVVDGMTGDCALDSGLITGSFLVPYNTPFQLSFNTSFSGFAADSDAVNAGMDYNFSGLSATPEPASFSLLALGLLAIPALRLARQARTV